MSLHQIIYTSCMRGINGVNDGQQIFSYDALFKDVNNTEIKKLFFYKTPTLDRDVKMSDEIVKTLPKSFVYKKLENNMSALALSTYLGCDYMGEKSRYGNHLSHVVIAEESDIKNYPCEFWESELLRDSMEFEEVNNPNQPDFLLTPILKKGLFVNIDSVNEFLRVDNRMEIFKDMLFAVLSFESARKRVLICDEPENIIMWIAAIGYTLPLQIALNINFSTYDFDPSLSDSQICGVLPKGTRYTNESQNLHFVFDLYQNNCIQFEKDQSYFEFIDIAMSLSYESLQYFHSFITKGFSYNKADEKIYDAYKLYLLLVDGVAGLSEKEIKLALGFANEYATKDQQDAIFYKLLEQNKVLLQKDIQTFLYIIKYMFSMYSLISESSKNIIKSLLVDKVLVEFFNNINGENTFVDFYDKINHIAFGNGVSVATELMKSENSNKLFSLMQNDIPTWQMSFIIKVVSAYEKNKIESISNNSRNENIEEIYYGLVKSAYLKNSENGFFLVTRILEEFSGNHVELLTKALAIEKMLFNICNTDEEVIRMWKVFGRIALAKHSSEFDFLYKTFMKYKKYDLMYMLFTLEMSKGSSISDLENIFNKQYKSFIITDNTYAQKYAMQISNDYYKILKDLSGEQADNAKVELFNIIYSLQINVSFAEHLVDDIIGKLSFEKPSKSNEKLIKNTSDYLYTCLDKKIHGKLALLLVAISIDKCKTIVQFNNEFQKLQETLLNGKADMSNMKYAYVEKYFDWILPELCVFCTKKNYIEALYSLFQMTNNMSVLFFAMCTKTYLKQYKKDFDVLSEFMGVILEMENSDIDDVVVQIFRKGHKQKTEELDETIKVMYAANRAAITHWNKIKSAINMTNPILNNISNLFKRKK